MVDATRDHLPRWEELDVLWARACADPGSPDRFEMSEHGELLWRSVRTNRRQAIVSWVCDTVVAQLGGRAFGQLCVRTTGAGIRVPDVSWLPDDRVDEALVDGPLRTCPPVVVELCLSGLDELAIRRKASAYLRSGAEEVLVVGPSGAVQRYTAADSSDRPGVTLRLPSGMFESLAPSQRLDC